MTRNRQRRVVTTTVVARRKKNAGRNRASQPRVTNPVRTLVPIGPPNQRVRRAPRRVRRGGMSGISQAGINFLKCAFASPDFAVDPGMGIPDTYQGRTVGIKDALTDSITFTEAKDTYILVAPVPGYAYFKCEVAPGAAPLNFVGVRFPTYHTNFGASGLNDQSNFTKFRYASIACGIYPTSNFMSFGGSIQVWKMDLNLNRRLSSAMVSTTATELFEQVEITGLDNAISPPRDNFTTSFINGAYAYGLDREDFQWCDFMRAVVYDSRQGVDGFPNLAAVSGVSPLQGLGNVQSIMYKIDTGAGVKNSASIKVWNCIEAQVTTNSAFYQFSGISPPHDPVAMQSYADLKMRLPVAVPAAQNAGMWNKVLSILRGLFSAVAYIPGPVGIAAGGLHSITSVLHDLTM